MPGSALGIGCPDRVPEPGQRPKRTTRLPRRVAGLTLVVLVAAALIAAAAIALGQVRVITTHGVSMNPVYYEGDLVVVEKARSYQVGEIVAYRTPAQPFVVLHRIIAGDASGFVMKGDNNESTDPHHPTAQQILGRAVVHIPHGGYWFRLMTSPAAVAFLVFMVLMSGGTAVTARHRRPTQPRTKPMTRANRKQPVHYPAHSPPNDRGQRDEPRSKAAGR